MKYALAFSLCVLAIGTAYADEAAQCQANRGTYLTGAVIRAPKFVRGHPQKGVELSHTHLLLKSDQDGRTYDVAIDNVFAEGYDAARRAVPDPLSSIQVGDRLGLCGKPFSGGHLGIDWVHTNCGNTSTPSKPDGWLKVLNPDGTGGRNLEGSQEYCRIFGR